MSAPRYWNRRGGRRAERSSRNLTPSTRKQADSQGSWTGGIRRRTPLCSYGASASLQTAITSGQPSTRGVQSAAQRVGHHPFTSEQSAFSVCLQAPPRDSVANRHLGSLIEWCPSLLRHYIAFIQRVYFPGLTRQAGQVLKRYYDRLRSGNTMRSTRGGSERMANLRGQGGGGGGGSGITFRFLESLFRLTQAHARLMSRHEALRQDASKSLPRVCAGR